MNKFAFVILHYNTVLETKKCVDSINSLIKNRLYYIIIVDNASPNKSGIELKDFYSKDNKISVLLSEQNVGFAKGNNIGIEYAKKTKGVDFVIVLNNDTYLLQKNFLDIVETEWYQSQFAVLGPKIKTYTRDDQNPVPYEITTEKEVNQAIIKTKIKLLRVFLGVENLWLNTKLFLKKLTNYKSAVVRRQMKNKNTRLENVNLHGCCLIFSPKFFNYFEGFDSRTFMYAEEDILLAHIRKKHLLSVYNPNLLIFHAEQAATKSINVSSRKKMLFFCRESLKSLNILKKIILENA